MENDFLEFFFNLISQINTAENKKTRYGFFSQNSAADSQGGFSRVIFKRNSHRFKKNNKCLLLGSKSPCFGAFC